MKKSIFLTLLLIFLSVPAFAQSYIGVGPEVTSASSSGFSGSNQTGAGVRVNGQIETKLGLPVTIGGTFTAKNNLPYFDTTGAALEMVPEGAMYFPLAKSDKTAWRLYTFGDMSVKRAQSVTIVNPGVGFGVQRLTNKPGSEQIDSSIRLQYGCRFDEINDGNGLNQELFREWEIKGQVIKRAADWGGFYFQGGIRKRMNSLIIPGQYQIGGSVGIVLF